MHSRKTHEIHTRHKKLYEMLIKKLGLKLCLSYLQEKYAKSMCYTIT